MVEDKKLFLIDAYALIYRSYYALIKSPRVNSKGFNTSAIYGFVNTMNEVLQKESPTHIAVAFDPPGPTFRHEMFEHYKAQRQETPEVIRESIPYIKAIVQAFRIPVIEVSGFEADDVIGSLSKLAESNGFTTYMMTPDKDYGQLVTEHSFIYKPRFSGSGFDILGVKEVCQRYEISSPLQVIDILGLMGDASDNIPGCPGVGEKTAMKLVAEYGSIENLLERRDSLKGALQQKIIQNEEQIRFSKVLATIKTDVPVEFDEKALHRDPINEPELKAIFDELEFRQLSARILGGVSSVTKTETVAAPTTGFQPSLFDLFADERPEDPKESILKSSKSVSHEYLCVENEKDILDLVQKINVQKKITLDTETTGTDPMTAELVGCSFSWEKSKAYYIPIPANRQEAQHLVGLFRSVLENPEIEKIGQNIKYDYIVLANYGVRLQGNFFDPMIAHYLWQPDQPHNMDHLSRTLLQYDPISIETLIGPKGKGQRSMRQVDLPIIVEYAAEDADVTNQLAIRLEDILKKEGLTNLAKNIEMPLIPILAEMELAGVQVDRKQLGELSTLLIERIIEIEQQIYGLAGTVFNISSPKQVGEILFDRLQIDPKAKKTKTGQYVTSEEVMEKLRNRHEIVGKILDMRGLRKLLSTYVNALPELIDEKTGRIHTSFNQAVTATGRLSSSNPNLQNIPIRDEDGREIRKAFTVPPGYHFLSADYSQIELRIMAHLSEDPQMIEAFLRGEDIHAATAARIYSIPIEQVTKEMRRKAKTANFGIIYGITPFGLSERLTIPVREAKELIDGYFNSFPRVKDYIEECIQQAKAKGYVETLFGRRRYLPDINSANATVRGFAERNAVNAPIQGTAADIIKVAMVHISRRLKSENLTSRMILQVHDELNFEVPDHELEVVRSLVVQEMEAAYVLKAPLLVECGAGLNWLDAH